MSKQNNNPVTAFALPINQGESSDGSLLVKKYLYHWPLFILCALIAIIGGYFYLKVAKPVYPIVATLEFKAPTASSASLTVNQNSTDQQLNPIDKPVIVENEIEIMQSKKLLYQVVNELQLWTNYYQKNGLATKDLYKRSPVQFKFIQQEGSVKPAGEKLEVHINDAKGFSYKDGAGNDVNSQFSAPVKSAFGTWKLEPTEKLSSFIDSTVTITIQDPDLVADGFQGNIKVALENKDAPFVNLSTSDVVPQRGKDVLNALMALYLQYAVEDKNKLSQRTLKFIDFRLDSLERELNNKEKLIDEYKSSRGMTDIVEQAKDYRNLNVGNVKELNEVDMQLGVLNNLEKYNSSQSTGKLPVATGSINDPSLITLYDKLSELQLKRGQLLATTNPNNPLVTSVEQQLASLRNDFSEKIRLSKAGLLAQRKQLATFEKSLQSNLKTVPGQAREIGALQRLQLSKENIYKFLLEKREQVALRYASSVSDSEVVDDAHAGKVKWPKASIVYGLAVLLGFAAAAAILYVRESMNDLITSRKQIEDETSMSILGELSYQDIDQQIVVSEGRSKFAIGEQFRVLRTNLYHLHNTNESGRVTLFTSSVSGEGKSFVSSNLAVTLAYASRKTIILEMDLRKPKVSVNFGLDPEKAGISNYLNEDVTDIKPLIQNSGIPNLDVLSCGAILPNPSELLEKEKLDELINTLKGMYDDVIIDSPPIHLVTDALIIARVADASLYVVRQGYTHKYELEFISEIQETNRFPKFTIVFNGVKSGASGYGYGYGYGGYGYGNNNYYNSYASVKKHGLGDKLKGIFSRF